MDLLPIGAFARLSRLTVKAVRHYDAAGLLVPAFVDPASGYRYYRSEQVRTATTIALLRGLDVPLPVVREVLAAPDADAAAAVLAGERARLVAELGRREQALRSIDGLLRSPQRIRYDVQIADRPPSWLAGVTGRVRADALDVDTGALCAAAVRAALAGGRSAREPLVAVFPLDLSEEFGVSAGFPCAADADPVAELPGGPWASALHVGPYPELPLAYAALLEHVRERGHCARGPVTETYLTDPSTAAPTELVTRLAVPVGE